MAQKVQDVGVDTAGPDRTGTSRWQKVVGAAGLAVVLWVGSEMYDVVFFDGSIGGANQDAPADRQQQNQQTSTTTGPHDPSRFGH